MLIDKQIEDLIEDGWNVIESDSDSAALRDWKRKVSDAFKTIVGPDPTHSTFCGSSPQTGGGLSVPARAGLLVATKGHMPKGRL